ncbi:hypothetical protein J6590_089119 [Homalodisca vitripennis]|nr:hypothetical protein J6590_089119 [Homalodisca vitripennis]
MALYSPCLHKRTQFFPHNACQHTVVTATRLLNSEDCRFVPPHQPDWPRPGAQLHVSSINRIGCFHHATVLIPWLRTPPVAINPFCCYVKSSFPTHGLSVVGRRGPSIPTLSLRHLRSPNFVAA